MNSAFGIDHGEVSKNLQMAQHNRVAIKRLKAKGVKQVKHPQSGEMIDLDKMPVPRSK